MNGLQKFIIFLCIIVIISMTFFNNGIKLNSEKTCGIDTCIYYNESEYYDWCDEYWGKNNWHIIHGVDTGLGGIFISTNVVYPNINSISLYDKIVHPIDLFNKITTIDFTESSCQPINT